MNDTFTSRLCSEAYLAEINVTPPTSDAENDLPYLTIELRGSEKVLKRAELLVIAAAKQENVEMKSTEEVLKKNREGHMVLAFYHLHPDHTPERILELVHQATLCNIGAAVTASVDYHDITNKKTNEVNTIFIPGVSVTISNKHAPTRKIVHDYLASKLNSIFHDRYVTGNVGKFGVPIQFKLEERLLSDDEPYDRIWLNFTDIRTSYGATAKLRSQGAAEHFSGMLSLPEIQPVRPVATISTNRFL